MYTKSQSLKELPVTLSTAAVLICVLIMAIKPYAPRSKAVVTISGEVGMNLLKSANQSVAVLPSPTQSAQSIREDQ